VVVRIGFLSIAHLHAHSYGRAINGLTGCRLVGIYDPDQERGMQGAKEMGTEYFADPAELLSQTDAVIICSENSRHREFTELAAKHGCHVLCEKPIATTLEDARGHDRCLRQERRETADRLSVRFVTPVSLGSRQCLIVERSARCWPSSAQTRARCPAAGLLIPELAGGGAVMDHTVHVVDLIRWFLGKEFVSVYAEVDNMLWDVEALTIAACLAWSWREASSSPRIQLVQA
jgi:UDP-N-acetylglucosamine 3-dehydrogenase